MPGATTTNRPFLIPGESGTNGASAPCAIPNFSDRPLVEFAGLHSSANNPPPPDDLWYVRLADWLPAPDAQPRSGGFQSADAGTIFFEAADEFAAELQSDAQLGLQPIEPKSETGRRVVLWMRDGDSVLRALSIDEACPAKNAKLLLETIDSAGEFRPYEGSQLSQSVPEQPPVSKANVACSLKVWTLWTNPLHG